MTTTVTPPKNTVPVGRVTIGGQTFDVQQHPEFVRFFYDLFKRAGGTSAKTNTELEADQTETDNLEPALYNAPVPPMFADDLMAPVAVDPLPLDDMSSARLEAAEAQIAQLFKLVNDLQSGAYL